MLISPPRRPGGTQGWPGTFVLYFSHEHGPGRVWPPRYRLPPLHWWVIAAKPLLGCELPGVPANVSTATSTYSHKLFILAWFKSVSQIPPSVNKASDFKGVFQITGCKYLCVRQFPEKASPIIMLFERCRIPRVSHEDLVSSFNQTGPNCFKLTVWDFVWLPLKS